jgi:hypothetical protein
MEKDTKQATGSKSRWRACLPWLGGIVLGAVLLMFGQAVYRIKIVGTYAYSAQLFIERDGLRLGPNYAVFINGKRAPFTFYLDLASGSFQQIISAGPIFSAERRVVYELYPRSRNPTHREHRFEIESEHGVCNAVFEIRDIVPHFIGCAAPAFDRAYDRY